MKALMLSILAAGLFTTSAAADQCTFEKQLKTLALNIYHEARGESVYGMQMVGEVTLNRVASDHYPDDICSVVYQKGQFSWVISKKDHRPRENLAWRMSVEIAYDLLTGRVYYFDNGATHYYNPDLVKRPYWALKKYKVATIGDHVFYSIEP